jgi:uncharacterized protein GlcG (DUF336 family)
MRQTNKRCWLRVGVCALLIAASVFIRDTHRAALAAAPDARDVNLASALRVIEVAIKKADAMGLKMNVAVVDAGANLKAFVRMDGAFLGSADIAMKKAKTSRMFDAPTGALGALTQPGAPLFGVEVSNGGLITFAGGLPLKNSAGEVIGAIGVSGSTVENDLAVAEAGAAAF